MNKTTILSYFERVIITLACVAALWAATYGRAFLPLIAMIGFGGYLVVLYFLRSRSYTLYVFFGFSILLLTSIFSIWRNLDFTFFYIDFDNVFFTALAIFSLGPFCAAACFLLLFMVGLPETDSRVLEEYEAAEKKISRNLFVGRTVGFGILAIGLSLYLIWKSVEWL